MKSRVERAINLSKQELVDAARQELARRRLRYFAQWMYPGYMESWHTLVLCQYLDLWVEGALPRLMVFVPPRHSKSLHCSELLPAFILGRYPHITTEIIAISYSQDLINSKSRRVQDMVDSAQFLELFPDVYRSPYKKSTEEWETLMPDAKDPQRTQVAGSYKCAGIGGGITGRGFKWGIIDDPHKDRAEAESERIRQVVYDWYKSTFYPRRAPDAPILLIQTRWHADDLAGRLLMEAESDPHADKWAVLTMPAVMDDDAFRDRDCVYRCPEDPRGLGEVLWPERYSLELLRPQMAWKYNWLSLYQQRPAPPGGSRINREWFQVVDRAPDGLSWQRFWDLAVSGKRKADFTASVKLAVSDQQDVFIADGIRGQWEWPYVRHMILQTSMAESPDVAVGIEEGGQQKGLIDDLFSRREFGNVPLTGIQTRKDILTRALVWIPRAAAGRVFLVRGPWMEDFLNECAAFTGAGDRHDDYISAVSGAYQMAMEGAGPRVRWL